MDRIVETPINPAWHERQSLEQLFWTKVDYHGPTGCWFWLGALDRNGSGILRYNNRTELAHRVAYLLVYDKPLPARIPYRSQCGANNCANPLHRKLALRK